MSEYCVYVCMSDGTHRVLGQEIETEIEIRSRDGSQGLDKDLYNNRLLC